MYAWHMKPLLFLLALTGCATSSYVDKRLVDKHGCSVHWDASTFKFFEDYIGWPTAASFHNISCNNGLAEGFGIVQLLTSSQQTVLLSEGKYVQGRPVGEHYGKIVIFVNDSLLSTSAVPDIMLTKWSFNNSGAPHGKQIYSGSKMQWFDDCNNGHCKGALAYFDIDVENELRTRSPNVNNALWPTHIQTPNTEMARNSSAKSPSTAPRITGDTMHGTPLIGTSSSHESARNYQPSINNSTQKSTKKFLVWTNRVQIQTQANTEPSLQPPPRPCLIA